jgi:hypothetical protein
MKTFSKTNKSNAVLIAARTRMKKFVLASAVLVSCSLTFAATPGTAKSSSRQDASTTLDKKSALGAVPDSPLATDNCAFTFTSGVNNTFLQYCVTVNGNIMQLQTPAGQPQITSNTDGEGYGICDVTGGVISYSDYGIFGTTTNWFPAGLTSLTGTSVKITRVTSDGNWTLTQTISQVAPTSSIKVVMAVKNNTAVARNVFVLRYADVDADGRPQDNLDGTHNTAMAWTSTPRGPVNGFGLMLQNVGTSSFDYDGFVQNIPQGPNPCNYAANFTAGVVTNTDGSLVLTYVGTIPANGTKTFNMMYKGL